MVSPSLPPPSPPSSLSDDFGGLAWPLSSLIVDIARVRSSSGGGGGGGGGGVVEVEVVGGIIEEYFTADEEGGERMVRVDDSVERALKKAYEGAVAKLEKEDGEEKEDGKDGEEEDYDGIMLRSLVKLQATAVERMRVAGGKLKGVKEVYEEAGVGLRHKGVVVGDMVGSPVGWSSLM